MNITKLQLSFVRKTKDVMDSVIQMDDGKNTKQKFIQNIMWRNLPVVAYICININMAKLKCANDNSKICILLLFDIIFRAEKFARQSWVILDIIDSLLLSKTY